MSSFRHFSVTIIKRTNFPHTFSLVERGMNFCDHLHTVAPAVLYKEVDVAADAAKCIL